MLRPRTIAAIRAARAAGIHVVIATGRMFRSVRPYARAAGIEEPLVCYQGAAVVDPVTGEWLLHEPIPLELAREAIAAVQAEGFGAQLLRRRRALRRRDHARTPAPTPTSRASRCTRSATCSPGSSARRRSSSSSTIPTSLDALRPRLDDAVRRAPLHRQVAAVLPRAGEPARSRRAAGSPSSPSTSASPAEQTVAFGDGENDLELLDWAGFGVCGRERARRAEGAAPTGSARPPRRRASRR